MPYEGSRHFRAGKSEALLGSDTQDEKIFV
jgi:hypothetical protein